MHTPLALVAIGEKLAEQAMATPFQKEITAAIPELKTQLISVELKYNHYFTPGLYIREMSAPKGVFIVGAVHKTEHPFVLSKGSILVHTESGGKELLSAPYFGITKAGTRRLAMVESDVVWTTFHVTEKTDIEGIKKEILFDDGNGIETIGN